MSKSGRTGDIYSKGTGLKIYGALVFVFLYFPLLIVLIFSFSPTRTIFGMEGLTLKWYRELFQDQQLLNAFFHSIIVGICAVIISTVIGTAGAFFLTKVNFPGKGLFRALVMLPFLLPGIIMGLTLLIFVRSINIPLSMFTILLGHVSFTTPIVMFQVSSRLLRMGPNYQYAAQDLGANPFQTFWYVTLPMIRTAIIGGALLAFTVSFDEIVISYFLTGTWMTLPVFIYGMLRFGLSPKVYAISTIILLMSLVLISFMARYIGRSGETYRVKKRSKGA
ncbi:ABC transporter permease subunit [candidate division KSB3 bacterium]|uniref:ABC transporter permease subunit n=1 Tax=candidate division KSB3 bacterium TaxID=2044937 RepID=A0A9D5JVZ4_9BACT|nr:ABC transporter permease subunit [candidate division KSB3 bacterium]MBD3324951.1 ABC transporter permease subunit [candidate division KSB3 bacterium]